MVGTEYSAYEGHPDAFAFGDAEITAFVEEINHAYPAANITREDVSFVHGGLLPMDALDKKTGDVRLSKHYEIVDHRETGVQGVVSVIGVKYTTARDVAERVVNYVFGKVWEKTGPGSTSAVVPLVGGRITQFDTFMQDAIRRQPCGLGEAAVRGLVYNYGSEYDGVLQYMNELNGDDEQTALATAQTCYAVREEMAYTLSDVIFRRTDLGTAAYPGDALVEHCASIMADELGWDEVRQQAEIDKVRARYW